MKTSPITLPSDPEIIACFEQNLKVPLEKILEHISHENLEAVVQVAYVLGFRDGADGAFNQLESSLNRFETSLKESLK